MNVLRPTSAAQVQEAVRSHPRLVVRGAGTKPALSHAHDEHAVLQTKALCGIIEYDPAEFTITALAGTSVREAVAALAANRQYLPFDPPLIEQGATLGGTVAARLSGPGRLRHGGVRDFLIGCQLVDGTGALVRGGGRVVKNAAGFDLPKLMTGSMGRLGVLTELTFKVFPAPVSSITVRLDCDDLPKAVETVCHLLGQPLDIDALDLLPPSTLLVRLSGDAEGLPSRGQRVQQVVGHEGEVIDGDAEHELWRGAREMTWLAPEHTLVKVALTPKRIPVLDPLLNAEGVERRYSVAGNVAWIAWPNARGLEALNATLKSTELQGLVVAGEPDRLWLGVPRERTFIRRVKQALDPQDRFPEL